MTSVSKERVSSFSILALGIFGAVFFIIHSLGLGDTRGYSSLDRIDQEIRQAEEQLAALVDQRQWLEKRIDLVSESQVDADLLGELARREMGLYATDDIVINLN
ncbi:MAG: FtsB family cell division protein [Candidatus Puniceispirillales bacterium]